MSFKFAMKVFFADVETGKKRIADLLMLFYGKKQNNIERLIGRGPTVVLLISSLHQSKVK